MEDHRKHIETLFSKYLADNYSEQELDELLSYFKLDEHTAQLKYLIEEEFYGQVPAPVDQQKFETRMREMRQVVFRRTESKGKSRRIRNWRAIAAAILVLLSISTLLVTYMLKSPEPELISQFGDDVLPGGNRAYIILSNGERIDLDSTQTGLTTTHGKHTYADGSELIQGSAAEYATIHTPVGGQYHIILPDGSEAWLNAASTIKYPLQFEQGQRLIETTGEVYLEIKSDKAKPFIVHTGDQRIEVLGTAFNVRNYQSTILTTLVHGKIALENKDLSEQVVLLPGEQSALSGTSIVVSKVNTADFTAWKNGIIFTDEVSLKQVCAELERWYGVKFVFPAGFQNTELSMNSINNKEMLSSVLAALKNSYKVDFEVRGKEVLVK